jgi:hypothetical protein
MMRRLAILVLVCAGVGVFLQREQDRGTFEAVERGALSQAQRMLRPLRAAPPVVLVELRQGDLPFESWPPAPLDFALVFESLVRRQPRAVVVQPLLAWPWVEPLDAATLAERIALLPRGVLSCTVQRQSEGRIEDDSGEVPLAVLPGASGDVGRVPEFDAVGQRPAEELRAGKAMGFTRIELGDGMAVVGPAVAVPLVARRGSTLSPSLSVQALLTWFDAPASDLVLQLGRRVLLGSVLEVPVDAAGRQYVSARLAPPLRRLDAGALLLDLEKDSVLLAERQEELDTLRLLEGALVVVGEAGERTPRFAVPGAPEGGWTEAEVVARSLMASLSGFHLREPPQQWQWIGWGVIGAFGALLLASPRGWLPFFSLGGLLALGLGWGLAFGWGHWWLAPIPPLGVWLGACVVAILLPYSSGKTGAPDTPSAADSTEAQSVSEIPGPVSVDEPAPAAPPAAERAGEEEQDESWARALVAEAEAEAEGMPIHEPEAEAGPVGEAGEDPADPRVTTGNRDRHQRSDTPREEG